MPLPNLTYVPQDKIPYFLIKNGVLFKLHSPSEIVAIMGNMKTEDEIIMRDNIGNAKAPICVKFAGTDACLASPFFADIVIERINPDFEYTPFGVNRAIGEESTSFIDTDWGKVKTYNPVKDIDRWFNEVWGKSLKNPNENEAIKLVI